MKSMKWLGPTWVTVDLDALAANIKQINSITSAKICPVIKGDAYGHGIAVVGLFLDHLKMPYVAVNDLWEAHELRAIGINTPILILTPCLPEQAEEIVTHNLIPTVTTKNVITT